LVKHRLSCIKKGATDVAPFTAIANNVRYWV
jgi:hypothetical protein